MNTHPGLFDLDRPRQVEVAGPELAGVLADLKSRGCIVLGMAAKGTGRWILSLDWSRARPVMVARRPALIRHATPPAFFFPGDHPDAPKPQIES